MKTWAKIFGVAALVSGAISFTSFGEDFVWGALKPLSATLFGAALICTLLAPEYAKYDEEQKERLYSAKREPPQPPQTRTSDASSGHPQAPK